MPKPLPQRNQCTAWFAPTRAPTLIGVGQQWMVSTSIGYIQWLSLVKLELKVVPIGRSRWLVAHTSKCEWTTNPTGWLHVDIFWLFIINLRCIPWIPLNLYVIFLKSWTSTGYFSNSTDSSVTSSQPSPFIVLYRGRQVHENSAHWESWANPVAILTFLLLSSYSWKCFGYSLQFYFEWELFLDMVQFIS